MSIHPYLLSQFRTFESHQPSPYQRCRLVLTWLRVTLQLERPEAAGKELVDGECWTRLGQHTFRNFAYAKH